MKDTLHYLLDRLISELTKDSSKNKVESLISQCVRKATIIANHTKNKKLRNDYLRAATSVNILNRKKDPSYRNTNLWGRIVYNTLMNTFPHRY